MASKALNTFIKIFLAMSTFFYLAAPSNLQGNSLIEWGYMVQELFFRYGALAVIAFSLFSKPKRTVNIATLGFIFLYLLLTSAMFSFDVASRRVLLNFAIAILFYKTVAEHSDLDLKSAGVWFFFIMLANYAMMALQYFRADPLYNSAFDYLPNYHELVGFLGLQPHVGSMAAILAPIIFFVNPLLVCLLLPMLWMTKNSTAVAVFVVIMSVIAHRKLPKLWFFVLMSLLIVSGAIFVICFDMPGGEFSRRFVVWHQALSHFLKTSPYFGIGLGTFAKLAPQMQISDHQVLVWTWAHNDFLQFTFEAGILGIGIVVYYLRTMFQRFNACIFSDKSFFLFMSFVSICGIAFMHFPFHLGRFVPICIFIMATFHAQTHEDLDEANTIYGT